MLKAMRLLVVTILLSIAPASFAQSFEGFESMFDGFSGYASVLSDDGTFILGHRFLEAPDREAFRWSNGTGLEFLGDLAGGGFYSQPFGGSQDASVIVGHSRIENNNFEAFRWTQTSGIVGLGDLGHHENVNSTARSASADGTVIVGDGTGENGSSQAFIWTEVAGMSGLERLVGESRSHAASVSADGDVLVGEIAFDNQEIQAFRWSPGEGTTLLGDLSGGSVISRAQDVSADGSAVVGSSSGVNGFEAFRWTEETGMEGLGDLPGGAFSSNASSTTADGSVIVGSGSTEDGATAFYWTESAAMRTVKSVLEDDYGLDLSGWTLTSATHISDDGTVIFGRGQNPDGLSEAWRAVLIPSFAVLKPDHDDLVVAGETATIKWTKPEGVPSIDVYLLPDTLGSEPVLLNFLVGDDSLNWTPDQDLFSRSARIRIFDSQNETVADTSEYFRIKPYHLSRLNADSSQYVPFEISKHAWTFSNTEDPAFPPDWYNEDQFDYISGTDPFTQLEYALEFTNPPTNGDFRVFPDWPSWVRAFGIGQTYLDLVPGAQATYNEMAITEWGVAHGGTGWNGSCFGFATSSLLAFTHRESFGLLYPTVGPVEEIGSITSMSSDIREIVNEQYVHQFGIESLDHGDAYVQTDPRTTLDELKARLSSDELNNAGTLSMFDVQSCSPFAVNGGHTVLPYKLERAPDFNGVWFVYVHDPNDPTNSNSVVAIDSTFNTWSYNSFDPGWGGTCGLYMELPIVNHIGEVQLSILPDQSTGQAPRSIDSTMLVYATPGATVDLSAKDGSGAIGFDGESMFNALDEAYPLVAKVGGPTRPYGYSIPRGDYSLELTGFPAERVSATLIDSTRIYSFGRQDAIEHQTDHLELDPNVGLLVRSDDAGVNKVIALRAITTAENLTEQTADIQSLTLTGIDSVHFGAIDESAGSAIRLTNRSSLKTYTLRLRQASSSNEALFIHDSVPLEAGVTHFVRPEWDALENGPVHVDIDRNGDGVPDDSLKLNNEIVTHVVDAEEPQATGLLAAYPNPFTDRVTISFGVPKAELVSISLHDMLGRRVSMIADGWYNPGRHEIIFGGRDLATGIYIVHLTTRSGSSQSHKVTFMR